MTTPRMTSAEFAQARKTLGLSQESLAALLNVRRDTLARWETGRDPIPYALPTELAEIASTRAAAIEAGFRPRARIELRDNLTPGEASQIVSGAGKLFESAAHALRDATITSQSTVRYSLDTATVIDPEIHWDTRMDEVAVTRLTYEYENMYGERTRSLTLIQVQTGLLVSQYVANGHLSDSHAAVVAELVASGGLPQAGASWEV